MKKTEKPVAINQENILNQAYSFGEYLILVIENEIKIKYKTSSPIFIYNFREFGTKNKMHKWADTILEQDRWLQYKPIGNDAFELKDFYPNPNDSTCYSKIHKFITFLKQYSSNTYGKEEIFFNRGDIIYNEQEILHEIMVGLRHGFLRIWDEDKLLEDPIPNKNRLIFSITLAQETEPEVGIESGFLDLENKY
jgi:hypothetical protein